MTVSSAGSPIRVLIVDDDPIVRQTLTVYLQDAEGLEPAGVCSDGGEALQVVRDDPPDVVLMDIHLPIMDGAAATRAITESAPDVPVLALTALASDDTIAGMLEAGATGCVLKTTSQHGLVSAILAVHDGITVLPADTVRRWRQRQSLPTAADLGERERQILDLLGQGLTNREIAHALVVSTSTVKSRVSDLLKKLGATSRTQLVARAHQLGSSRAGDLADQH